MLLLVMGLDPNEKNLALNFRISWCNIYSAEQTYLSISEFLFRVSVVDYGSGLY